MQRQAEHPPDRQIIGVDERVRGNDRRHGGTEAPRQAEESIARLDDVSSGARGASHGHVEITLPIRSWYYSIIGRGDPVPGLGPEFHDLL